MRRYLFIDPVFNTDSVFNTDPVFIAVSVSKVASVFMADSVFIAVFGELTVYRLCRFPTNWCPDDDVYRRRRFVDLANLSTVDFPPRIVSVDRLC